MSRNFYGRAINKPLILVESSEPIIQNETEDEPEPEEELPEEESLEEPSRFENEDVTETESDSRKHSADKGNEFIPTTKSQAYTCFCFRFRI